MVVGSPPISHCCSLAVAFLTCLEFGLFSIFFIFIGPTTFPKNYIAEKFTKLTLHGEMEALVLQVSKTKTRFRRSKSSRKWNRTEKCHVSCHVHYHNFMCKVTLTQTMQFLYEKDTCYFAHAIFNLRSNFHYTYPTCGSIINDKFQGFFS
jgi:hypothetical protein